MRCSLAANICLFPTHERRETLPGFLIWTARDTNHLGVPPAGDVCALGKFCQVYTNLVIGGVAIARRMGRVWFFVAVYDKVCLLTLRGCYLVGYENQPLSETLPGFQFVSPRFLVFAGQCLFSILIACYSFPIGLFTLGWGGVSDHSVC